MTTLKNVAGPSKMTDDEREHFNLVRSQLVAISASAQMEAWMRLFTKVNSILVGKKVPTSLQYGTMRYPAITSGQDIVFSAEWIRQRVLNPMTTDPHSAKKNVAMLKGIDYHEVGHVLFSPARDESPYARALTSACEKAAVREVSVWTPANLIEDQRIETLFTAMFSGAKLFFRASTLEGMLKDGRGGTLEPKTEFVFTHGRRFLPRSLRLMYRASARQQIGDALVDAWMEMMDEYTTLSLTADDADRAAELTLVAADLLAKMGVMTPPNPHGQSKPGQTGKGKQDEKRSKEAAEKARQEVADDAEKDAEAEEKANSATSPCEDDDDEEEESEEKSTGSSDADDTEDDEASDDSDDTGGDATDDADDDADESEDGEGDGSPEDGETADSDDTSPEHNNSDEGGYSEEENDDEVYSEEEPLTIEEALEQLYEDANLMSEVQNMINDFKSEAEKGAVERPKKNRTGLPNLPDSHEVGVSNRLFRILQQMRADAGSSRERQMEHGKLNVMDFMLRKPWDLDIFEYFEEGREDEFDMEVVILLDMSPSMASFAQRASLALWQIKLAMQRFDVPVTCYGYNDGTAKVLYGPTDVVRSSSYENFGSGGCGTDPLDGLTRAYNIFSRSSATRKILVTITDGQWNGNTRLQSDALVERINQFPGATSIIVGLTHSKGYLLVPGDRTSYHQHHLGVEVTDPASILDVFKEYVLGVGRKAMSR